MNHKNLKVWQSSVDFAVEIYQATKSFPDDEKFGITSQMRRAAISIPSNIAEGAARSGKKEFLRFLTISAGSASELNTQLLISQKIGLLDETITSELNGHLNSISQLIQGLMRSLRKRGE